MTRALPVSMHSMAKRNKPTGWSRGTGPGYHAIHFASQGYSATVIDGSATAIERAERNAEKAGVQVDFRVADATKLDGFGGRFDTVVDSAVYHALVDDEACRPGTRRRCTGPPNPARACACSSSARTTSTGLQWTGIPADNFERVLGAGGWRLDHLGGTTTYLARFGPQTFDAMSKVLAEQQGETLERMLPLKQQMEVLRPLLRDGLVHFPVWSVVASRLD